MRVVLTVLGAILGALLRLALSSSGIVPYLLLGAVAGFGLAEVWALRRRLGEAEEALSALAKRVAGLRRELEQSAVPQRPASAPGRETAASAAGTGPDLAGAPGSAAASDFAAAHGSAAAPDFAGVYGPGAAPGRAVASGPAGALDFAGAHGSAAAPDFAVGPGPRAAAGPAVASGPAGAPDFARAHGSAAAPGPGAAPSPALARAAETAPGRAAGGPGDHRPPVPAPEVTAAVRPSPARAADRPRGDVFEAAWRLVREYFTGGNTLVRVGIVVLFFGVAFLLRYLAEHTRLPIELRLSGVAVGGIVLLLLGWKLRARRRGYALALQGGSVGILYLTVFAGLRLYALLSPGMAFALLIAMAVLSAALAVLQDSQSFALLGVIGGFLAPILASTGEGSHVVLFSYYAVLNVGLVLIAWFRAWRPLNLVGFLFTFVISTTWGVLRYRPEMFSSTEPFLVLFFLLYLAIAILFAQRQAPQLRGYVDGTLVFGTPLAALGLQSALLLGHRFELALSALTVGALYLALAWGLHRRQRDSQRLLTEAFMALGVLFLTLAVPLGLNGRWSSATWSIEGAGLMWVGCRQGRRLPRAFGALLQIAGGIVFWTDSPTAQAALPVLNSACVDGVLVSTAAVFSAATLERERERRSEDAGPISTGLFFWGLLWWLFTGLSEIQRSVPDRYDAATGLVFLAATSLISSELTRRARLGIARPPALWLLPAMLAYTLLAVVEVHHPLADGGWVSWPCAFAVFYFLCKRHEGPANGRLARVLHAGGAWLLIALLSWEVAWAIDTGVHGRGSWNAIARALVPAGALLALVRSGRSRRWPVGTHRETYVAVAGTGLAAYLGLWSLLTDLSQNGDPDPFPYVPLLNPLDVAQLFVLLVLLRYWLHLRAAPYSLRDRIGDPAAFGLLAALAFVWLNAALLRTLHYWSGVPLEPLELLRSTLVQTSVSIFWAVLALASMLIATRKSARVVWLVGAALLAVVIGKLFLVDLARVGTIERIVSFVVVGVLMLIVGYFSPLPPTSAPQAGPGPT